MSISLTNPIHSLSRLSPDHASGLLRLTIETIEDLLYHFPTRYADIREETHVTHIEKGAQVTIYGVMEKVSVKRSFKGHIPMTEARVTDETGSIRCIWFNQAYIGKMYPDGTKVKIGGLVQEDSRGLFLSNPHIEKLTTVPNHNDSLFAGTVSPEFLTPIYSETKGITSNYLYTLIKKAVAGGVLDGIHDPIPPHIIKKLHLPELKEALLYIHFPKSEALTVAARKRFAFEEIFYLQLKQYQEKIEAKHSLAYPVIVDKEDTKSFMNSFPFTPTEAQVHAINAILDDMTRKEPMGRMLEGDVGSGKTFVAATVSHAVLQNKIGKTGKTLQIAYMAPTEILAKQHFESFVSYFKNTGVEIGLLTGSGCLKYPSKTNQDEPISISRAQLLTWLSDGRVSIVIGTHALIQKTVTFAHLALIIIDEQHRFGVKQRKMLATKKGETRKELPHLLSMTATPIPRTLALTIFGDLDLTVIDAMPLERKKIITEIVPNKNRTETYERIRKELQAGRQVYVICPRIDEQDEEEKQKRMLKSVKEEAERLSEIIFPEFIVDILHSKMKKDEKEEVMQDFLDKKSDILVATSVVEVGVNVPNATVIVIEHADRFGLAQLHQLRGRVGRREYQSYCYLFTESYGETTRNRLKALVTAKNGFELAEQDMMARGIGMLMDGKQWGISDLAMEAIKNPKLVEVARTEARELLDNDGTLENYPDLALIVTKRQDVHME
ncbi:MAG: ATP-dependent DNA helicase RecG [Candidatus Pacebacteria bacterium]|nr:ATP-dependent DNA helicase RecG [Candidatus Paceibacterota bacterium]MBP9866975.1 ATP-dependent DNA helicase RecG [Candidatus Paceibacterota bacterium]